MPDQFSLKDLDDPDKVMEFLRGPASAGGTGDLNRTRVESQLYLAHKTKAAGETLAASLAALAQAFRDAATASDKHAKGLNFATWALVGVTLLLAVVQGYAMYRGCP